MKYYEDGFVSRTDNNLYRYAYTNLNYPENVWWLASPSITSNMYFCCVQSSIVSRSFLYELSADLNYNLALAFKV